MKTVIEAISKRPEIDEGNLTPIDDVLNDLVMQKRVDKATLCLLNYN